MTARREKKAESSEKRRLTNQLTLGRLVQLRFKLFFIYLLLLFYFFVFAEPCRNSRALGHMSERIIEERENEVEQKI